MQIVAQGMKRGLIHLAIEAQSGSAMAEPLADDLLVIVIGMSVVLLAADIARLWGDSQHAPL